MTGEEKLTIGVQSYCFRNFRDNQKVAADMKECGLSRLELCGVHVDFGNPSRFKDVLALYRDNGIEIVSIGVNACTKDKNGTRNLFECARMAGADVMSVTFLRDQVPESYRTAEALADEYGINCAIHNHGRHDWLGSSRELRKTFGETTERIGLCLDTAWALDAGEDPVKMAAEFADRLYLLHVKDFVFDRAGKPEDVVAGEGNLKLEALLSEMKTAHFEGCAIIEYEGDPNNPVPAIRRSVENLVAAMGER